MPGSPTPHKLDDWPPTAEGHQDLPGMNEYLLNRIVEHGRDAAVMLRNVDQNAIDDILERLMTLGVAALTDGVPDDEDDPRPHVAALAKALLALQSQRARVALETLAR